MSVRFKILGVSLAVMALPWLSLASGGQLSSATEGSADVTATALPIVRAGEPVRCGKAVPCGTQLAARSSARSTHHTNPTDIDVDGEWVTFLLPGIYEINSAGESISLIAVGASGKQNADIAHAFATKASDGSSRDHQTFMAGRERFVRGMFEREDTVGLACGMTAQTMGMLLDEMGLAHRIVQWIGPRADDTAHQSLEVALPGAGWTLYDPHIGVSFAPGTSALDVFEMVSRHEPIGPFVEQFFEKAKWLERPWNVYERYTRAVGHFQGKRLVMLVADGDDCCGPDLIGSWEMERVTRDDFIRRYYSDGFPASQQ